MLDAQGATADTLGADTGLVAATKIDDRDPVWFVTGTDDGGRRGGRRGARRGDADDGLRARRARRARRRGPGPLSQVPSRAACGSAFRRRARTASGASRSCPRSSASSSRKGLEVVVEPGAGEAGDAPRRRCSSDAGATIGDPWGADVVVKVAPPSDEEIGRLAGDSVLVGFLAPRTQRRDDCRRWRRAGVTAFAMEAIPRISRAQSMDALSSQSNVAGYKAALLGRRALDALLPDADDRGGHDPAREGARARRRRRGAAGDRHRAAAGRADDRLRRAPARSPSRSSRSARSASTSGSRRAGEGGYARELTEEEQGPSSSALTDAIKGFDVVITTALVPGRPAPRLVTAEAVEGMKPGSVIVDLAGEAGGNCELTEPGRGRRRARRHDRLAAEPAGDDARARQPALRAQRPGAARAADRRGRRRWRWTSTTRSSPARA